MYRKTKFLEVLEDIREEMSREAEYDVLTLTEIVRNGRKDIATRQRQEPDVPAEEQSSKDQKSKIKDRNLIYGNRI